MSATESLDHIHQVFEKISALPRGNRSTHFENCTFKNCDFTGSKFDSCDFLNCTFENCNLSMVKFGHVGCDQIHFKDCKMIGVDFSNTKDFLFHVNFTNCILDYATFMKKKNRKATFRNCTLKGTDFSEADLTQTVFEQCDLSGAVFMQSILTSANFSTSYNYVIDPARNTIKKAKFSVHGLAGLLETYGIIVEHTD